MDTGVIGIIGGSGFYDMPGITDVRTEEVDTPYGKTLDPVVLGRIGGREVAFISRHGKGHRVNPTHVPVRANIFALKLLGVTHLISVSAVGSMREELAPEHMVVPDQLFDRTVHRPRTFFEHGLVVHVAFDKPYCSDLRAKLVAAATQAGGTVHDGGTYMCVEGPQFSTRAESETYRGWGMSIIGMTALPEARLAREAEMCYATLAMVTDYDTWHPDHDSVTVDMVVQTLNKNVHLARNTVAAVISTIGASRECSCGSALQSAIMTAPEMVPADVKQQMRPLIGRYVE